MRWVGSKILFECEMHFNKWNKSTLLSLVDIYVVVKTCQLIPKDTVTSETISSLLLAHSTVVSVFHESKAEIVAVWKLSVYDKIVCLVKLQFNFTFEELE